MLIANAVAMVIAIGLAIAALGALALDIGLRVVGISSFPLFTRDPASVYRMASSQSGRFRKRFGWTYNRFGMRSAAEPSSLAGLTVLVGDSVVDGGSHFDQSQTLAARFEAAIGQPCMPVACHGWALTNELGALTALPGWQQAKRLVWVINTGDIGFVGDGAGELSFPTRRPIWLVPWLVRRHIYRHNPAWWPWRRTDEAPAPDPAIAAAALARFGEVVGQTSADVLIVRYPMRDQDPTQERYFEQLAATRPGIRLIDPANEPDWGADCYLDFIHPNPHGVEILARCIANAIA